MQDSEDALDAIFSALANAARRGILSQLSHGPQTAGELASPLDISNAAVSQHLKVLENSGLIRRTVNAQWRSCTIRTQPLDDVSAWIDHHRQLWNERFDLLAEQLNELDGGQEND